jgi:hypothetical protein
MILENPFSRLLGFARLRTEAKVHNEKAHRQKPGSRGAPPRTRSDELYWMSIKSQTIPDTAAFL